MRLPEFRMESLFTGCLVAAALIGLTNLYSAAGGGQEEYFWRQVLATAAGVGICAVLAATDYRSLRRTGALLYILGNVVLLLTALMGREVKATRSWLSFGIFSVQPSELFKGIFILHLAAYLGQIQREHRATLLRGLFIPLLLLAIPVALTLYQGDAGTAAVYIPVFFVMIYTAGLHFALIGIALSVGALAAATATLRVFIETTHTGWEAFIQKYLFGSLAWPVFGLTFLACALFLILRLRFTHYRGGHKTRFVMLMVAVLFAGLQSGEVFYQKLKPHQKNRIASFFNPQIDPRGAGYQALQARIAVGSGGIWGKGYFKGTQKGLGFLPEQWTDFAFSVLAEEWGFAGSTATLLIYGLLIGSALSIGRNATDLYGCLVATGTAALYFIHMGIGVAMNLGAFPVVGIPMPFLSYGGSAQVLNFMMAGLTLSVARHRRLLAA
ncbi:MAG: hypothetical protein A3G34_08810 [Candidatus Lindowbacteria bacterium RIFCSPLOWO2_12_FULL_62_27]|nr:MAG: hypothetical protein A3I06_08665 [Candidatus Lindowbacteria bacterium RIFCSPLOWO2_02_FULL_62_12]OGH60798.1 MAG: hypothetical protein A3G34_08810 [Candidatus Lindowbacteria bacterium RIFCSPLOWO2_12_FULL_62_27]